MEFFLIIWIGCGIASAAIASNKGRGGCAWFAIGFLLGPLGVLIAAVMSPDHTALKEKAIETGTHRKCPMCAEMVLAEAKICKYCKSELPQAATE